MLVRASVLAALTLLASGAAELRAQEKVPAPAKEPADTAMVRSRRMGPGFDFYNFRMPRMTFRAMPRFWFNGGDMWQGAAGRAGMERGMSRLRDRLQDGRFERMMRLQDRNFERGMRLQERAMDRTRDRGMALRERLETRMREPRLAEPRSRFRLPSRRYRPI